jgi:transposase
MFSNRVDSLTMSRGDLTDKQWKRLQPLLPPQKTRRGRPAKSHRQLHQRRREPFDKQRYRQRNQVERLINSLKRFRRVATRYEKLSHNYLAMVTIAAITIWLRVLVES